MKEQHKRLMPGKNDFIPGVEITSYFPDPIEICFVGTGLTFTPGVPTEDGWYVVKVKYRNMEIYDTIHILNGDWDMDGNILSHAKLPEL